MGSAAPLVAPDARARLLITFLAAALGGGGLLKLFQFLVQRRSTLRALDATSDSTLAGAMSTFLGEVRVDRAEDRDEIRGLKDESRELADEIRDLRLQLQAADLAIGAERREREHLVDEMERVKEDLRLARVEIDSLHRKLGPLADPVPDAEQILEDKRDS